MQQAVNRAPMRPGGARPAPRPAPPARSAQPRRETASYDWSNDPIEVWGPRGWRWLHHAAIGYASDPTLGEARTAFRRIWDFVSGLPCVECRTHGLLYIIHCPPDLSSSEALQRWMHTFHNSVNARLGKPEMSYDDYRAKYRDEICWAHWGHGCRSLRR